jgi:peptide deformylase
MIRKIIHDPAILTTPSTAASPDNPEDAKILKNLVDTLQFHSDNCAGMAANMIGFNKNIIVVNFGMISVPMVNPVITKKSGIFKVMEGCISLKGERLATRYENIEVQYLDAQFQKHTQKFTGFVAEVIQHEIDHCNGILI